MQSYKNTNNRRTRDMPCMYIASVLVCCSVIQLNTHRKTLYKLIDGFIEQINNEN